MADRHQIRRTDLEPVDAKFIYAVKDIMRSLKHSLRYFSEMYDSLESEHDDAVRELQLQQSLCSRDRTVNNTLQSDVEEQPPNQSDLLNSSNEVRKSTGHDNEQAKAAFAEPSFDMETESYYLTDKGLIVYFDIIHMVGMDPYPNFRYYFIENRHNHQVAPVRHDKINRRLDNPVVKRFLAKHPFCPRLSLPTEEEPEYRSKGVQTL
ncbi:hypothetical protein K490DRAFT_65976 [Saccharata proteae CBS 121410]|uniref:Uncharacterized protein n=1 Tax=Saccharata proteae CBS 121410 TaxID=1314787 RepID=A0A9P4HWZ0_9PEZI|nr:hypothetical protein K490DRAFT_65976 [Saccharata proteae CBS 121410]